MSTLALLGSALGVFVLGYLAGRTDHLWRAAADHERSSDEVLERRARSGQL